MTSPDSSQHAATHVYLDAFLPTDEVARLQQRQDIILTIADPIVDDKAVGRPPSDLAPVEIMLCTYPPENLEDARRLNVIQLASSGYGQAQGLDLPSRGIRVCNARGVNDSAIAEWNLAMMINLSRNLKQMVRNQQLHIWDRAPVFQREIRGSTVGIWGYGSIGRQTARLCKALDLRVYVLTHSGVLPSPHIYCVRNSGDADGKLPDRVFTAVERMEFLQSLDFLILCLPLDAQTKGIVGEAELRALPKKCFVLNPARGPLIDQSALLQALCDGWIAGAAIDTHYEYPLPADHPLWEFENVILTPHISGSTGSPFFKTRLADLFVQNIDRYRDRRPLLNQLADEKLRN